MSLVGKRIVVTRALHQADSLVNLLEAKGAIPLLYPCIAILPRKLELDLSAYDWLIISSSNTAYALKDYDFSHIKIAAVGTTSAQSVAEYLGQKVAFIPEIQTGQALAENLPIKEGSRVLLPQSALAKDEISQILTQRGAILETKIAYENSIGQGGEDIPNLLKNNLVDALSFTSPSTVENFVQRIAPATAYHLPAAVIGTSTATCAKEKGFQKIIMPSDFKIEAMLDALAEYFAN